MKENTTSDEIDLGYLSQKLNALGKKVVRGILMIIDFFLKYWIITLTLIIVGIGLGYFSDRSSKNILSNEGIVIPNFESVDYLYGTIDDFNSRINSGDTIFLKKVLGPHYFAIKSIEIEAIPDINHFAANREQIDVFRILYQNQDFEEFMANIAVNRNFKYHKVKFMISEIGNAEEIVNNILTYLNANEHFRNYAKVYNRNVELQIEEYHQMLAQVDSIIKAVSFRTKNNTISGVSISDNSNLDMLLVQKREILSELMKTEINLVDFTSPIKLVYMDYNVETGGIPKFIKYPIIFVGLFSLIFFIRFIMVRMRKYSRRI